MGAGGDIGGQKVIFLFARQRSGTGALAGLLNKHPDCAYLGEVFGDAYAGHPAYYFNWLEKAVADEPSLIQPERARERFEAYLAHVSVCVPKPRVILDVKLSQLHHFEGYDKGLETKPALLDFVKDRGGTVLFLRRRNLLRAHLSRLTAEKSGVWHTTGERPALPKLAVDVQKLKKSLEWRQRVENRLDGFEKLFPGAISLDYETLFDAAGEALSTEAAISLEGALRLKGFENLKTDQTKLRPGSLDSFVENIDEVRAVLKGTSAEWMLEG
ncbi:hypothetical protein [Kordiimonas sp.]|uniref:hypothetical protein n=1 Tax=Kordiimonas sp. TaxID=1970157 RepID=UPI003A91376E